MKAKKAMRKEAKQTYKVAFVDDVTIPDGSNVMAGDVIQKTWRLKNAGATAWPEGTEIICVRGDAMMVEDVVAVSCAPGDTVDVSVDLKVGSKLGRSKTIFRLKIPSGRRIGAKLWLDVFVVVPATVIRVPTAEPPTQIQLSPSMPLSEAPSAPTEPESASSVEVAPEPAEQEQKLSDAEEAAIAVLTEMGFTDRHMLISLLEAAGGNVKTVLGWLM